MKTVIGYDALMCLVCLVCLAQNANAQERHGLPQGFHDFVPIYGYQPQDVSSEALGNLCLSWEKGVSVAQRVRDGADEDTAVETVNLLNKSIECTRFSRLTLRPVAVAVRGDSYGRPITIIRYQVLGRNQFLYSPTLQ